MNAGQETVSFWRSWGIAVVCWAAAGLIFGRFMFLNDRDHANYLPYAHYFVWEGAEAFSWAVLTPFIFLIARRYPFQRERWLLRTVQYIGMTAALICIEPAFKSPAWLYKPDQHRPFLITMVDLGQKGWFAVVQVALLLFFLSAYQGKKRQARRLSCAKRIWRHG